jgi:hypothetical protein
MWRSWIRLLTWVQRRRYFRWLELVRDKGIWDDICDFRCDVPSENGVLAPVAQVSYLGHVRLCTRSPSVRNANDRIHIPERTLQ